MNDAEMQRCVRQMSYLRVGWRLEFAVCGCNPKHDPVKTVVSPDGSQFTATLSREKALKIARRMLDVGSGALGIASQAATLPEFVGWLATETGVLSEIGKLAAIAIALEDNGITWADLGVTAERSS